jgi:hypothetical protein
MTQRDAARAAVRAMAQASGVPWCEPDDCPAVICGGPHAQVDTSLGTETVPTAYPDFTR